MEILGICFQYGIKFSGRQYIHVNSLQSMVWKTTQRSTGRLLTSTLLLPQLILRVKYQEDSKKILPLYLTLRKLNWKKARNIYGANVAGVKISHFATVLTTAQSSSLFCLRQNELEKFGYVNANTPNQVPSVMTLI